MGDRESGQERARRGKGAGAGAARGGLGWRVLPDSMRGTGRRAGEDSAMASRGVKGGSERASEASRPRRGLTGPASL